MLIHAPIVDRALPGPQERVVADLGERSLLPQAVVQGRSFLDDPAVVPSYDQHGRTPRRSAPSSTLATRRLRVTAAESCSSLVACPALLLLHACSPSVRVVASKRKGAVRPAPRTAFGIDPVRHTGPLSGPAHHCHADHLVGCRAGGRSSTRRVAARRSRAANEWLTMGRIRE